MSQDHPPFKNATCRGAYAFGTACGHCERCDIDPLNPKNAGKEVSTPEGKVITTTEHPDGRKDVHIEVNMLDVEVNDPETAKAKEVIETQILPQLADADVLVVVVHKPTNRHSQKVVKLPQVRAYAEAAIKAFVQAQEASVNDFVIVEHHITNGTVSVTSL